MAYSSCPTKLLINPANDQATKIYEGAEKTGGNSPQGDGHKIGFQPPCRPVSIIGLQRVRHFRVFLGLAAFIDVPAGPSVVVGGRLTQRADGTDLVGPAQGIAEIPLNRLSIIPAAAIPFRPDRLERPPAYKPQAKAHRAYKPQPLPAVEAHVEFSNVRTSYFYKILLASVDIEWDRARAGYQLPGAAPICTTPVLRVQTGY